MLDFIRELYKKYNFSEEQIGRFAKNFALVYIAGLVEGVYLTKSEQEEIGQLSEEYRWDDILNLIKLKFPSYLDWEGYTKDVLDTLMDDYCKQVLIRGGK